MEQFPHLKFVHKLTGKPRLFGGGEPNERSEYNKENREEHSTNLSKNANQIRSDWEDTLSRRDEHDFAKLDPEIVPIFLQINPDIITAEFDLQSLGIEIVSEEEEGFIIGASVDNLRSLEEKINGFLNAEHGSGKIADLWSIVAGNRDAWKPEYILSSTLFEKWPQIDDETMYSVEVSIAFDKPLGTEPDPGKQGGVRRLEEYRRKQRERETQLIERENSFDSFIKHYGSRTSGFVGLDDCFGCEVYISGKGLKDLVINYAYVFEVNELEEIGRTEGGVTNELDIELEVIAPEEHAPIVGVVDSGIMEDHRYIVDAIDRRNSKSYLHADAFTIDDVAEGGHGTRVAGAILYPKGISNYVSPYRLPCFIRNIRVLDRENVLSHVYPAELIKQILNDHPDCSIFNHSIGSKSVHRKRHMSSWAATIDNFTYKQNVLFVISAGNVLRAAIREYLNRGLDYPVYLESPYCSIVNPSQSCFAITVGSTNHSSIDNDLTKSLGNTNEISAFSRIGPGIWNTIKPDVVEYGGGLLVSKNNLNLVSYSRETAPELLRSTLHGGSFNGNDAVGTSFAAPKVTYILSVLKALYPNETVNLLRGLLIQGARLPGEYFLSPTTSAVRYLGYGIPSIDRVTKNTEHRISFYNTGEIRAEEGHIYSLRIPEQLRDPGNEYDILIEVTLAYTAKIRRTRQKVKSYLSTWLDWSNSKLGESFDQFRDYALKEIHDEVTDYDKETRKQFSNIDWKFGNRVDSGAIRNYNRNNNTIQKDWAIIKSYELSEDMSFAIRGHKGWDKNREAVPYAFIVSLEILGQNIPIYESIRVENELELEIEG